MEVSPSAGAVAHLPNHKLKLNLQSLAVQQLVDEGCDVLDADGIVTVNVGKWGHLIVAQQDVIRPVASPMEKRPSPLRSPGWGCSIAVPVTFTVTEQPPLMCEKVIVALWVPRVKGR